MHNSDILLSGSEQGSSETGIDLFEARDDGTEKIDRQTSDLYYQAAYLQRVGRLDEAKYLYREIQARIGGEKPEDREALARERFDDARAWAKGKRLPSKLSLGTSKLKKLNNLHQIGLKHFRIQEYDEAIANFLAALDIDANQPTILGNLGTCYFQTGQYDEALRYLLFALRINPKQTSTLNSIGLVLMEFGLLKEAAEYFDHAVVSKPDYATGYLNKGIVFQKMRFYDAALTNYAYAIGKDAALPNAYATRAHLFMRLKNYECALADFKKFEELCPGAAMMEIGIALFELRRLDEAIDWFDRQVESGERIGIAFANKAVALQQAGRFDEAFHVQEQVIHSEPNNAMAYWNLSTLLLLMGQFDVGWELYEWRWKRDDFRSREHLFGTPLWLGEPDLGGKTLLIVEEQGLGDMIQFCRYALLLEQVGAKVFLELPKVLCGFLSTLSPTVGIVEKGQTLPPHDYYCPIMSLPFAMRTRLETIPATERYLQVDAGRRQDWKLRLGTTEKLRVGVAWSGRATHANDANRSIGLDQFCSLFSVDAEFHCLQKEFRDGDLAALAAHPNVHVWHATIGDFRDTAALASHMDVVVGVDTSVVHMAAATGMPTWVLLPFVPDYRWLLGRDDSPWYPTMRLFRQPRTDDWASVLDAVRDTLQQALTSSPISPQEPFEPNALSSWCPSPVAEEDPTDSLTIQFAAAAGARSPEVVVSETADFVYVHSPITYSLVRELLAQGIVRDPVVFCGRTMSWPDSYISVNDDGIWNVDHVAGFLGELVKVLERRNARRLNVYLPHTGYLLGTLLKQADAVQNIFYIEEGSAAYDPACVNRARSVPDLNAVRLASLLDANGTARRLGLDLSLVRNIRSLPFIFFDSRHAKYAGAYAVSDEAFSGMEQIRQVSLSPLEPAATGKAPWVCILFNLTEAFLKLQGNARAGLWHRLMTMLSTQKTMLESINASMVIKLHPQDRLNFDDELKAEIFRFGMPYEVFCDQHGFDSNLEVALIGFEKYMMINQSSADRYIRMFRGDASLVRLALD